MENNDLLKIVTEMTFESFKTDFMRLSFHVCTENLNSEIMPAYYTKAIV